MQNPEFKSETTFEQGETPQGRWQARQVREQSPYGRRSAYAYASAQGSGHAETYQVMTAINLEDHTVFQVSPDGTVRLIQPSCETHSYSESRSGSY